MTPTDLEILPCKVCGAVPIPARVSKHTGIYRIRCTTWDCKNNLIVEGIDYGHAVLKWNECMTKMRKPIDVVLDILCREEDLDEMYDKLAEKEGKDG